MHCYQILCHMLYHSIAKTLILCIIYASKTYNNQELYAVIPKTVKYDIQLVVQSSRKKVIF